MISHVVTIMKDVNKIKTNIMVGSDVTLKVVDVEKNTREARSIRMSDEVVVYVQYVLAKKKFLVQF